MTYEQKLKRNIKLYYVVQFISNFLLIIPIWVTFQRQFLTFTEMSLLSAFRFGLTFLLELPTGAFADLVGRKKSVILGFILEGIGLVVIAFANSPFEVLIWAVLAGVGDAFRSGADTALVYDSLKEAKQEARYSKVNANSSLITQFAIILSSISAGYLFSAWEGAPYFVYGLLQFLAAILYLFIQEPKIDSEKFTWKNYIKQAKLGLKETVKNAHIAKLSLFYALVAGITWAWQIYFNQIFADSIGYGPEERSWLSAIIRAVNVFVVIRLLKIDKLFARKTAILFFCFNVIISALPAYWANQFVGTGLLFFMTLGSTLRFIVLDKFVNEEFDSKYRATAVSALNLYLSFVYLIFVAGSGPLIDNYSVGLIYLIAGVIAIVLILPLGLTLIREIKKSEAKVNLENGVVSKEDLSQVL